MSPFAMQSMETSARRAVARRALAMWLGAAVLAAGWGASACQSSGSSGSSTKGQDEALTFVYIANAGLDTISGFLVHAQDGSLSEVPGSPFEAEDQVLDLAAAPDGTSLFAANYNPSGTISSYRVDAGTGELTEGPGSPVAAGDRPRAIAVDSEGSYLYVALEGDSEVVSYAINSSNAGLTQAFGDPVGAIQPLDIAIARNGDYLLVSDEGNVSVRVLAVQGDGEFAATGETASADAFPEHMSLHADGDIVYVADTSPAAGGVLIFSGVESGQLDMVSGTLDAECEAIDVFTGGLRTAYVLCLGELWAMDINPDTGALSPQAGTPEDAGADPARVALDPLTSFAFVTDRAEDSIYVYHLDESSGAPSLLGTTDLPSGAAPEGIAVVRIGP